MAQKSLMESIGMVLEGKTEEKPVDKAHFCATHVEHTTYGMGVCISEEHAEPDAEGNIEWYTVQFEGKDPMQVMTAEMKILQAEGHMHSGKKKKMAEENSVEEAKIPAGDGRQKLDVHEPEKDELTKHDFKKLRSMKKEEAETEEQVEELIETIIKHNDFTIEIPETPTYADYLGAIKTIVDSDDIEIQKEIIAIATEAFRIQDIDVIIEARTQMFADKTVSDMRKNSKDLAISDPESVKHEGKPGYKYTKKDMKTGKTSVTIHTAQGVVHRQ